MEEHGRLYAMLLNGGRLPALQSIAATGAPSGDRLLSEEASFIVLDMLKRNPRPDTGVPASPSVAWKTGTSWGFHDAWSVAVFDRFVLVVWIGNFDNSGNPAFVGVQAAAPLLFRIVDALRSEGQDAGDITRRMPANVARVEVCAASGDLPNAAWFPRCAPALWRRCPCAPTQPRELRRYTGSPATHTWAGHPSARVWRGCLPNRGVTRCAASTIEELPMLVNSSWISCHESNIV